MGQHRKGADRGTDGCRKSGSERTHITCKHEEIVSEYVEDTSGKHRSCCKRRVLVISQVCGKHLIEQEERDRKFDREHILSSQSERIVLCAEHDQELPVKQDYDQPDDCRQYDRTDHRCCKVFIRLLNICVGFPSDRTEEHRASNSHQKSEAVDDVPYRSHHRKRRGALRPVILPHHSHIHDGIDRCDQCAAECRRQILKLDRFDLSIQKIHFSHPPVIHLLKQKTG